MPIAKAKKQTETKQKQFIFTSKEVESIIEKSGMGWSIPRHMNPWFKNQVGVRKTGCPFGWTQHELDEFTKCKLDIHYFANKFCKIKTEDGTVKQMKLRQYQYKVLDVYDKNRFVINMSSRQTGKTITAAITLLHYCIFNSNKGVMIVANKGDTVVEIIDKIKNIYKLLPFFLKPGVINWNSKSIVFDNGCRIKSQARSKEPAIGFTIDFLYMDEFAHIPSSMARQYYKAAVPTVSSINNSKILITSTPNGANLFKELVIGAELPEGHQDKNQYKCIRVYWHEVEGRLDPKFYPLATEMKKWNVTFNQVEKTLKAAGFGVTRETEQSDNGEKGLLRINFENGKNPVEVVRNLEIEGVKLGVLGTVTNWKESETKLIGGEEAFNQEYNIQFIAGSKRVLSSKAANRIEKRVIPYSWEQIEIFEKLRFTYDELKWHPDFDHSTRHKYHWVTKIDVSEGLGLDYSVLNLFRIMVKDLEWLKENKIKNLYEAFYLKQTGIFQHNRLHPTELADLLYLLQFEYLDPEKAKIVMEYNGPGGRLLDALPNCFDQNNNYGEYVFVRYKHNQKDKFKKAARKVTSNKKDDVKIWIEAMEQDNIYIDEPNTALEVENFIKIETKSGNITYKADSGHDDICMTLVNGASIFETPEWKTMCQTVYNELDQVTQNIIDSALDLTYNPKANGYKAVSGAMRSIRNGITGRGRIRK